MKCLWCGHSEHAFEPGKSYCEDCTLKCERECVGCKKPYPNLKAFALNEKRCNSCQKKYEHNKKKREMKLEDDIENDQIKEPEEAAKDMGMENSEDDGGEEDEEDSDGEDNDYSIIDDRDSKAKLYGKKRRSRNKLVSKGRRPARNKIHQK